MSLPLDSIIDKFLHDDPTPQYFEASWFGSGQREHILRRQIEKIRSAPFTTSTPEERRFLEKAQSGKTTALLIYALASAMVSNSTTTINRAGMRTYQKAFEQIDALMSRSFPQFEYTWDHTDNTCAIRRATFYNGSTLYVAVPQRRNSFTSS